MGIRRNVLAGEGFYVKFGPPHFYAAHMIFSEELWDVLCRGRGGEPVEVHHSAFLHVICVRVLTASKHFPNVIRQLRQLIDQWLAQLKILIITDLPNLLVSKIANWGIERRVEFLTRVEIDRRTNRSRVLHILLYFVYRWWPLVLWQSQDHGRRIKLRLVLVVDEVGVQNLLPCRYGFDLHVLILSEAWFWLNISESLMRLEDDLAVEEAGVFIWVLDILFHQIPHPLILFSIVRKQQLLVVLNIEG